MEQKRTLWIIAAVGVFLLVVVGAALILYSPSLHNSKASASHKTTDDWMEPSAPAAPEPIAPPAANPDGTQAPDGTMNANALPGQLPDGTQPGANGSAPASTAPNGTPAGQPVQSDNVTVISGNTTVYGTGTTTIDLNTLKASHAQPSSNVTAQNQMAENAMNTTASQQQSYNYQQSAQEPAYEEPKASVKTTSAKVTKTAAKSSSKKTEQTSAAKTTAKTASAAPAKVADRWWVQAASFSAKKNADDARATLEANKISSEVFTWKDSKGKLFYRVRIGPYTTKSEAEYWQARIKYIDQFAKVDSYVVNSSAKAVK